MKSAGALTMALAPMDLDLERAVLGAGFYTVATARAVADALVADLLASGAVDESVGR